MTDPHFQPTMLGHVVYFGDDEGNEIAKGIINDETETKIYIQSEQKGYSGWMEKDYYRESLGTPD